MIKSINFIKKDAYEMSISEKTDSLTISPFLLPFPQSSRVKSISENL